VLNPASAKVRKAVSEKWSGGGPFHATIGKTAPPAPQPVHGSEAPVSPHARTPANNNTETSNNAVLRFTVRPFRWSCVLLEVRTLHLRPSERRTFPRPTLPETGSSTLNFRASAGYPQAVPCGLREPPRLSHPALSKNKPGRLSRKTQRHKQRTFTGTVSVLVLDFLQKLPCFLLVFRVVSVLYR